MTAAPLSLRGFIALQGNSNPAVTRTVGLDAAYIELGGLHMGVSDNAFDGGINGETDILGGAKVNRIAYNLLVDGPEGGASYEIDLPNGGDAVVIGKLFKTSAHPLLTLHDSVFKPITRFAIFEILTAGLTWIWFQISWKVFSLLEQRGSPE